MHLFEPVIRNLLIIAVARLLIYEIQICLSETGKSRHLGLFLRNCISQILKITLKYLVQLWDATM